MTSFPGAFRRQCQRLMRGASRVHVGHRGFYSIERLQALDDYYRVASSRRSLYGAALPTLLLEVGLDFIPLQDPHDGWKSNHGIWLRYAVAGSGISLGFLLQIRQLVPDLDLTAFKMACIMTATTCSFLGFMLITASLWDFPTPFSVVLAVPPFMLTLVCCIFTSIGRQHLQMRPNLRHQLKKQFGLIVAQSSLALVYPAFGAVYNWLPPSQKTGFVLVLPVMKFVMQNVVAWMAMHLEEYVPVITVFSVELFNALYTAKCMQNATSISTYVVIR